MIGMSTNNVDARPIKKRASSLNSVSANSDTSTSTENSVQQNTAYIKKSFFKYENYDLNVGSSIEMKDLVYESAYDDFKNEMVCFNLEASSGITIEGETVINPKPTELASFECFKNPERIVIDSKAYAINNSFYIFTTEFNKSQNKYDWTDTININLKEDDDKVVIVTKKSYENMIKSCKDIDIDTLKNIKNLLTASTVTSGISAVGGIANTVMGGVSIANDNSKEDKSDTNKKLDIATTIVSGVTTATSGASTATSAVAISKVNTVIDKVNECKKAINNLVMKID